MLNIPEDRLVDSALVLTRYFFKVKPLTELEKVLQLDLKIPNPFLIYAFAPDFSENIIKHLMKKVEEAEISPMVFFVGLHPSVMKTIGEGVSESVISDLTVPPNILN